MYTDGTTTISSADGLPVELMDFSVEGDGEPESPSAEKASGTDYE